MTKFKNSFMGFNKEDVITYIESLIKTSGNNDKISSATIAGLSAECDTLKNKLAIANKNLSDVIEINATITNELSVLKSKQDDINLLSDKIGRMYLVSKANANAVLYAADQNAKTCDEEVARNLSAISSAHSSLSAIKDELQKATSVFSLEIDDLFSTLSEAKSVITANTVEIEKINIGITAELDK